MDVRVTSHLSSAVVLPPAGVVLRAFSSTASSTACSGQVGRRCARGSCHCNTYNTNIQVGYMCEKKYYIASVQR